MPLRPWEARRFDGRHLGWKVNPESPLARTRLGFDTTDHVLDAVVDSDLATWRWKDEDEFAEAIDLGLFPAGEDDRIREEACRVLNLILTSRREAARRWMPPTLASGWKNRLRF
ncbi:MAG: hypothetical protein ACRDSJ_03885 [Rubrobacteraceae bacterium]